MDVGSRRIVMEPAPELTLTTRGVALDFLSSGAKNSSINRGPVALVWKHCDICCASGPGTTATAALLTSASTLVRLVSKVSKSCKKLKRRRNWLYGKVDLCIPAMLAFDALRRSYN